MKITEHNASTGEIIEREATQEELTQLELDVMAAELRRKAIEEKAAAKSLLLERLGITAEEATLLLS